MEHKITFHTWSYPEPNESSPHAPKQSPEETFQFALASLRVCLPSESLKFTFLD
jgi:hypothetical protein